MLVDLENCSRCGGGVELNERGFPAHCVDDQCPFLKIVQSGKQTQRDFVKSPVPDAFTFMGRTFITKQMAEALGYTVDTHVYPWLAYMGPRFQPKATFEIPTDREWHVWAGIQSFEQVSKELYNRMGAKDPEESVESLAARIADLKRMQMRAAFATITAARLLLLHGADK
jgi:hypothetical protein